MDAFTSKMSDDALIQITQDIRAGKETKDVKEFRASYLLFLIGILPYSQIHKGLTLDQVLDALAKATGLDKEEQRAETLAIFPQFSQGKKLYIQFDYNFK